MAGKVINQNFQVGERYRGQINGKTFEVKEIIKKDSIEYGRSGGWWPATSDTVRFFCEEDQRICSVGLQAARHMLLTRIEVAV